MATTPLKNTSLVVLYKSKIMESSTVLSLLKANNSGVHLKIIIWNNGPDYLEQNDVNNFGNECDEKGVIFEIYQDVRNISLSRLYNFCINKNLDTDFFTILDQDSVLSDDFLTNLVNYSSFELIVPMICDVKKTNKHRYPFNYSTKSVLCEGEFDAGKIFTMGSGLSLSNSLIFKIIKKYQNLFCEDYVFYYVDTELFFRIKTIGCITGYCCGSMLHSESAGLKYDEMPEITKLEMGYMQIISRLNRKKGLTKNLFFCLIYKFKKRCSYMSLFRMIKCVFTKKHPRSIFKLSLSLTPEYSNIKSQQNNVI